MILILCLDVSGIGDQCKNGGVTNFVKLLSDWSGSQGYCMYAIIKLIFYLMCLVLFHFLFVFPYPIAYFKDQVILVPMCYR